MGAEFVAAVQIIVYGGAIMVLFIFVIMLLNAGEEERTNFSKLATICGHSPGGCGHRVDCGSHCEFADVGGYACCDSGDADVHAGRFRRCCSPNLFIRLS